MVTLLEETNDKLENSDLTDEDLIEDKINYCKKASDVFNDV